MPVPTDPWECIHIIENGEHYTAAPEKGGSMTRVIIIRDNKQVTLDIGEECTPELWASILPLANLAFARGNGEVPAEVRLARDMLANPPATFEEGVERARGIFL